MSKYKVYDKGGSVVRCTLDKVEYNGSFMDSRVVNATVESGEPIGFEIYDYVTYRGEKFELDYKPSSTKNSSSGSAGDAYVYELTFVSLKYELERCEMRDLVPYDNGIVYPSPLTIEFTGTAGKLAERIQACLDKLYSGTRKWTVSVAPGVTDEEKNISISQANCWSAVSLFNTEYGLDFYISGRTVTVGGTGTAIDFTFRYGKGNGLYKIERSADTDKGVVTRLRAYGGTRNIGDNYLRDKTEWPDSTLPASMYLPNLMLPGFETTGIDYIDAGNASEYGIREGSVVYEDIYPSLSGMTNSKGQRIDEIQGAETVSDDTSSEFWITTYDLEFEKPLGDYVVTGGIPTVYIKTGQLQGYSFEINASKMEKQSDGGYKLFLARNTGDGFTVPNKDVNLTAGTEFVLLGIAMPKAYVEAAEERLLARAEEYLAKYSKTNYGYEIGLDEIFAARNPDIYGTLYEGRKLHVVDEDLGIDEEITIQSLTISEEYGSIPVYKITLNNEVSASTLNRIQGQVSQLESTVTNGFTLLKWQTEQYYRRMGRPYALWTRDGTTIWLSIDESKLYATLDATLASSRDIVCYATEESFDDLGLPVAADYTTTGLFRAKEGGGLLYEAAGGWYVNPDFAGGGGKNFTVGTGLEMSSSDILSVKYGTTAGTACEGDDPRLSDARKNPNALSWSGYESGSYDGSEAASFTIPDRVSAFTNDMGYIRDGNEKITVLQGSGNASKYLAGDGKFYTISHTEIDGLEGNYVTIATKQTVTGYKNFAGKIEVGPLTNVHILLGEGSGNCINGVDASGAIKNLYFNYGSSTYTKIDADNNVITGGDVVANATGAAVNGIPVADGSTYGLVKYDNSTIKKNGSGQLYCTVQGGSGGSAVSVSRYVTSGTRIATITIDGTGTDLYAPSSSGGTTVSWGTTYTNYVQLTVAGTTKNVSLNGHTHGYSTVRFSRSLSSGTKIGTITIDGSSTDIYAPSSGGGSSFTLASATFNSEIVWSSPSTSYGIRIRRTGNSTETRISGNVIDGRTGSSYSVGNLYFNYSSGSNNVRIDSSGKIYSNGSQVTSDLRLKTVEGNEEDVLDRMMQIPVIKFRRNDIQNSEQITGFGAQSFIGVFDNVAFINEDSGYYGINEGTIMAITFQGVKELYAKLQSQQAQITALQEQVKSLLDTLNGMKGGTE